VELNTPIKKVPENWLTAYQCLFLVGSLAKGETVLIHAGASGVGIAANQLAQATGA
jgi:tumor protein p53-inducible protein 3